MSETTDTAVIPAESGSAIAKASESDLFFKVDLASLKETPNLEDYAIANLELASEYFKGKNLAEGETVRILFVKLENQSLPSKADKTIMEDVPTVFFYAKNKQGDFTLFQNSSKKFVNSISNFGALPGMGFAVTYLGKIEYKNGNEGDNWSIKPMLKNPVANTSSGTAEAQAK